AAAVATALDPLRYDVVSLLVRRDGTWAGPDGALGPTAASGLAAALRLLAECDVTIPMVHGAVGEDGTLAGLLDLAGVTYVGSGVRAGAVAMDKWVTKLVARALGIAVAPGTLLTRTRAADLGRLPQLPVVV